MKAFKEFLKKIISFLNQEFLEESNSFGQEVHTFLKIQDHVKIFLKFYDVSTAEKFFKYILKIFTIFIRRKVLTNTFEN